MERRAWRKGSSHTPTVLYRAGKMVKSLEDSPMRKIRIEKLTLNICVGEVRLFDFLLGFL